MSDDVETVAYGPRAVVVDADPLRRILAVAAVDALGLDVRCQPLPAGRSVTPGSTRFVALDDLGGCRRCADPAQPQSSGDDPRPLPAGRGTDARVVGYGSASPLVLAAHRLHLCCDLVLRLVAVAGRPRLAHLDDDDEMRRASLTPREADVLVLLAAGLSTPAVAARLSVSAATARSHCRAVLRKLGDADRRALRARLCAPSTTAAAPGFTLVPTAAERSWEVRSRDGSAVPGPYGL